MNNDFVPWIEFLNGILAITIGPIIIYSLLNKNFLKENRTKQLILIISSIQIYE